MDIFLSSRPLFYPDAPLSLLHHANMHHWAGHVSHLTNLFHGDVKILEFLSIAFLIILLVYIAMYLTPLQSMILYDIALYCTAVICRKGDAVAELEAGMWAGGKNQLSLHPDDLDEDFDALTSASLWNVGKLSSWCQVEVYIVYVVYSKRVQNESPNEYPIVYH